MTLNASRLILLTLACCALAAPARAETITVTTADCATLMRHVPSPDVAYKPGVDVHGKKVAPADLPGSNPIAVPKIVNIPITIDLAARYGIPATSNLFKAEAYAGTARVRVSDGRAWFNGKPLSSNDAHALAQLCQKTAP
ncbi:MAG: hypothetical protein ACI82H_001668 [Alphaproteobacteria bacterium]|jgi:hypothetical protein